MEKVEKTEEEWRKELTPEQYKILREAGTEPPFTGIYNDEKTDGVYRCAACGLELFSSDTKFDSGTGWPSFWDPMEDDNVITRPDNSLMMGRTEVLCALRQPPRPRVRRRAEPDGPALLHQLGRARSSTKRTATRSST